MIHHNYCSPLKIQFCKITFKATWKWDWTKYQDLCHSIEREDKQELVAEKMVSQTTKAGKFRVTECATAGMKDARFEKKWNQYSDSIVI